VHRLSVACASARARQATISDFRALRKAFEHPPSWLPASGSVAAQLRAEHCPVKGSASAELDARLSRLLVRAGKVDLDLSGTLNVEARLDTQSRQLELSRLTASLDPLRLNRGEGERPVSVQTRLKVREGRVDLRRGDISAKAYASAGNPRPVIERLTSPPLLADIGIAALPLGATRLAAGIERTQGTTKVSLLDAESGSVQARGKLSFANSASGRIFVTTPLLDFELRVNNGDVSVHPLRDGD
jgi:hypothetical protein